MHGCPMFRIWLLNGRSFDHVSAVLNLPGHTLRYFTSVVRVLNSMLGFQGYFFHVLFLFLVCMVFLTLQQTCITLVQSSTDEVVDLILGSENSCLNLAIHYVRQEEKDIHTIEEISSATSTLGAPGSIGKIIIKRFHKIVQKSMDVHKVCFYNF